jgi:hypothetical protein
MPIFRKGPGGVPLEPPLNPFGPSFRLPDIEIVTNRRYLEEFTRFEELVLEVTEAGAADDAARDTAEGLVPKLVEGDVDMRHLVDLMTRPIALGFMCVVCELELGWQRPGQIDRRVAFFLMGAHAHLPPAVKEEGFSLIGGYLVGLIYFLSRTNPDGGPMDNYIPDFRFAIAPPGEAGATK